MGVLSWIIIGVITGFLAKLAMPSAQEDPSDFLGTMLLGIIGAVIGGWLWDLFLSTPGAVGFDFGSVCVAFVGSVIVISTLRLFGRKSIPQ